MNSSSFFGIKSFKLLQTTPTEDWNRFSKYLWLNFSKPSTVFIYFTILLLNFTVMYLCSKHKDGKRKRRAPTHDEILRFKNTESKLHHIEAPHYLFLLHLRIHNFTTKKWPKIASVPSITLRSVYNCVYYIHIRVTKHS